MPMRPKDDGKLPRCYGYFSDFINIEEMCTESQRQTLTELICLNILDEDKQEEYLSQLDDMTATEANEMIFEFRMARW